MSANTWRTARWLWRHQAVARLLNRIPLTREWISRRVWREAEADPVFVERLARGRAELEAGRGILYEVVDGELRRVSDGRAIG